MYRQELVYGSILVAVSTIPLEPERDIMFYLGVVWAISMGIMFKAVTTYQKEKQFNWQSFIVQLMITLPVCFFSYRIYLTYKLDFDLATYMFFISLSAQSIAIMINKVSAFGWSAVGDSILHQISNALKKKEEEVK